MLENMTKSVDRFNQRKRVMWQDERHKTRMARIKKLNHRNKKGDYYWKLPSIEQRFGIIR